MDGPWELRRAVRQRLREDPDAIKIWATGGGIWRWDSGRAQHYCAEEIKAVIDEAKMVGIPVWSHCYNSHSAAYDSVRFGCEQLIHGFDIDERTMDLMAEQGTFFTPTIGFLPTWYSTYLLSMCPRSTIGSPAIRWSRRSCNATTIVCAKPRGEVWSLPLVPTPSRS